MVSNPLKTRDKCQLSLCNISHYAGHRLVPESAHASAESPYPMVSTHLKAESVGRAARARLSQKRRRYTRPAAVILNNCVARVYARTYRESAQKQVRDRNVATWVHQHPALCALITQELNLQPPVSPG